MVSLRRFRPLQVLPQPRLLQGPTIGTRRSPRNWNVQKHSNKLDESSGGSVNLSHVPCGAGLAFCQVPILAGFLPLVLVLTHLLFSQSWYVFKISGLQRIIESRLASIRQASSKFSLWYFGAPFTPIACKHFQSVRELVAELCRFVSSGTAQKSASKKALPGLAECPGGAVSFANQLWS